MSTCLAPETSPQSATAGGSGGGVGMPPHQVVRFARAMDGVFDRLRDEPTWSMTEDEQREALLVLGRVGSRLAELEMRVLASADRNDVGADSGSTSTAAWLASQTRHTHAHCSAATRLATELDETFHATREALADGRITVDQAAVVVKAVSSLVREHDDLPPDIHARAEAHLLDLAGDFDAKVLRRLGRRLFEVVCPEAADRAEGDQLAEEEERARQTASMSMHDKGDGTVEGRFRLPLLHGELLKKALEALTSPRRIGEGRIDPATGKKVPYDVLLGRGFMELLENHLDPKSLPSQGGSPFTLVVTIGIDALMSGLGVATLETGGRISAGEARRLACKAGLIPMVLDGDSVVLDMGREQRLFDKYQRIAMAHRYGGCATASCDRPPAWTEAHHTKPWHQGGRTDLADGLPLCPPHHHMADNPTAWKMRTMPSGKVRFSRRRQ